VVSPHLTPLKTARRSFSSSIRHTWQSLFLTINETLRGYFLINVEIFLPIVKVNQFGWRVVWRCQRVILGRAPEARGTPPPQT